LLGLTTLLAVDAPGTERNVTDSMMPSEILAAEASQGRRRKTEGSSGLRL